MWPVFELIDSVWHIPEVSVIVEGLGGGGNHDKIDLVRAPIHLDYSVLCPSCSICFLIFIAPNPRDTATCTTKTHIPLLPHS